MTFEHSYFLEVQDIVVSKQLGQLGPQGCQNWMHQDHLQEMMGEPVRRNRYAKRRGTFAQEVGKIQNKGMFLLSLYDVRSKIQG
jgi:hypothetical protein